MSVRTNLVINPSFEVNVTYWQFASGTGGTASLTSVASTTPNAVTGSKCARLTWSAATSSPGGLVNTWSNVMPAQAGKTYTWSVYVRSSKAQTVLARIIFNNATPSNIGQTDGAFVTLTANVWTRLSVTATAPAATAFVQGWAGVASAANGGVNWAVGDTFDLDGALVEESATLGSYFDGATPDQPTIDYAWTGTAHASTSTETDNTVIFTVLDKTPTRLRLQLTNPGGFNLGSIMRTDPNGTHSVRAESGALPSSATSLVVLDYEYPLLYHATIVYTAYSTGNVALGSLTIDATHPAYNTQRGLLHITVPVRPDSGVVLNSGELFEGGVIVRWEDSRETRHTVHTVVGREDPVVVLHKAATRTGTMEIDCPSLQKAQLVEKTLAQPYVFLLRQSDQLSLGMYFVPTSTALTHSEEAWTQTAPDTQQPERRWIVTVGFAEVGWPTGYVTPVKVWTWNDVVASYSDWNAVTAKFKTWADLLERQES